MITDNELGQRIREFRTARGLTQSAFQEHLWDAGWGIDKSAVSRIESGLRTVRATELFVIADVLGVPVDDLYERSFKDRVQAMERRVRLIKDTRVRLDREQQGVEQEISRLLMGVPLDACGPEM